MDSFMIRPQLHKLKLHKVIYPTVLNPSFAEITIDYDVSKSKKTDIFGLSFIIDD